MLSLFIESDITTCLTSVPICEDCILIKNSTEFCIILVLITMLRPTCVSRCGLCVFDLRQLYAHLHYCALCLRELEGRDLIETRGTALHQ